MASTLLRCAHFAIPSHSVEEGNNRGVYLGFIGREDPTDKNSESLFQAPLGLKIEGDKLYVMDRFAGLFMFDLGNA